MMEAADFAKTCFSAPCFRHCTYTRVLLVADMTIPFIISWALVMVCTSTAQFVAVCTLAAAKASSLLPFCFRHSTGSTRTNVKSFRRERDAESVTQRTLKLRTAEQVADLVKQCGDAMSDSDAVSCFWRLGKLRSTIQYGFQAHVLLDALFDRIQRLISSQTLDLDALCEVVLAAAYLKGRLTTSSGLDIILRSGAAALIGFGDDAPVTPANLAGVAWALAKTNTLRQAEFLWLRRRLVSSMHGSSVGDLCKLAWAFATCGKGDAPLFEAIAEQVAKRSEDLSPRDISQLAWSLASLGLNLPSFVAILMQCASASIAQFNPQDLSTFAWAVAKLNASSVAPVGAIVENTIQKLHEFQPRNVANLAWAFATIGEAPPALFNKLGNEAVAKIRMFSAQELSNIIWAFAAAAKHDAALEHAVATASTFKVRDFKPQELSSLAWGFAALGAANHDADNECSVLHAIAANTIRRVRDFSPQSLSNLAWSWATLVVSDTAFLGAIAHESVIKMKDFEAQSISNALWAFAVLAMHDETFLKAMAIATHSQLSGFIAQDLANVAWAFATLGHYDPVLLNLLASAAAASIDQFAPQGLANLAWAFAALAYFDASLFRALTKASLGQLQHFSRQEISSLLWSYSILDVRELQLVQAIAGDVVARLGRSLDAGKPWCEGRSLPRENASRRFADVPPLAAPRICGGIILEPHAPHALANFHDRLVVFKPPGWEVDQCDDESDGQDCGALKISNFLQALLPERRRPIIRDTDHKKGILHRLDVPCSGLILVATTYEAYFDLRLQLDAGQLVRDYVVLCHGCVPSWQHEVSSRVLTRPNLGGAVGGVTTAGNDNDVVGTVHRSGRPSRTWLRVLARTIHWSSDYSFASVRIATGRRKQIRSHMAHTGHPVVCDGKYAAVDKYQADQRWCPRLFLHRCRLRFSDSFGAPRDIVLPLPIDLGSALSSHSPVDARSERELQRWLRSCGAPVSGVGGSSPSELGDLMVRM